MLDLSRPAGALIKTTLVDYPARVACALFLHGCNLRCPYCQNADLVTGTFTDYECVTFSDVCAHLTKRSGVISGFVISGGEPFTHSCLPELIAFAHSLNYAVKLDTNGMFPEKLEELLRPVMQTAASAPDFVALDIKTSPVRYGELTKIPADTVGAQKAAISIEKSISITGSMNRTNREFRTVLVPGLADETEIRAIASLLPHDASWQLARFSNKNCLSESFRSLNPYTEEKYRDLESLAKSLIPGAVLR